LELVYFDPEFRRWQLFQEQPDLLNSAGGDAKHPIDHRRTIQKLLQSIRTLFENLPLDEWGIPLQVSTDRIQAGDVTLNITDDQRKQYANCLHERVISEFVDALKASADNDNIWEANSALQNAITGLGRWLRTAQTSAIQIGRTAALQMISLLPILPHWDLWGAIRQGWETSEEKGIPPSPFQRLGELRSPFYSNHFVYQYNGTEDQDLGSRKLLGYTILAEAEFIDLDDRQPGSASIHLRDYFDYACTPGGEELAAYQIYALLLDRLQLGLSGQEVDSKAENKIEHLYYVAWPIFTSLGRRHFLQLYARPIPDSPAPAAKRLHDAFLQLHQHLSWADLRDILGEELTQVDLDRFHAHIARHGDDIAAKRYVADEQSEAVLTRLMAGNLELLMPVDAAQYSHAGNSARWSYQSFGETVPLGFKWIEEDSKSFKSLPEALGDLSWRPASLEGETPTQHELRKAFRHWLVERQLRALRRDWDAKRYERERKRDDAESLWKTKHYPHLAAQTHQILGKVNHAAQGRDRFNGVTFTLGEDSNVSPEEFFKPYFYFNGLDSGAPSSWEDAYRCLLTANGHLVISYFVETGVLYWLTHPSRRNDQHSIAAIRDALDSSNKALQPILQLAGQANHQTCLDCILKRAEQVVGKANGAKVTSLDLRGLNTYQSALSGPSCNSCERHGDRLPLWLTPTVSEKQPQNAHALMDLAMMRERAFRFQGSIPMPRLKSLFGLAEEDSLTVIPGGNDAPTIHIAPAGLPGWAEALTKLRGEHGVLKAFFFAESMAHPPGSAHGGKFYPPTSFQRNYLAVFKGITLDDYQQIGTTRVDRLEAFHTSLRGLGLVYCMKLNKDGERVAERFCYLMPENKEMPWKDVTQLVQQNNPAVFGQAFEGLTDGHWEAIVVVLDRVKR
jgi:hypothetical protein